jgi:predicted MPP superfamily phosphohydrolase
MNRKRFAFRAICSTGLILILGLILYSIWIEPNKIETHHVWIQERNLAKIFGDRVIVQLSDLHIGTLGTRERKTLEILDGLKPDIIFLTGDYVAWDGDYRPALEFLYSLKAKIGIWAVMGDYDYSNSRRSCLFCHEKGTRIPTSRHSVRFLRDNIETLKLPEGTVNIAGIDIQKRWPEDSSLLSKIGSGNTSTIILSHSPLAFDFIGDREKIVMLAGDTHGGQIPLPDWLFSIFGYEKNAVYSHGLFERNGNQLFVSRGLGTSHIPVRFLRQPEVVVLHFIPPIAESE